MGRIGKLIKTEIEKFIIATVETRFKYNQTADFYAASGDDAPPLEKDRIALVGIDGTGNFAAIGVLMVSQGAKPGERILYSRDEDGNPQAILKLLGDGKIEAVSPGGVKVSTDDNYELEVKKDMTVKVDGNTKFSGKVEITGGNMKCKGTATPSGTGCFCALPTCPVTGAPHTGEMVMNT
jgi:hypothetical protein